MAKIIEEKLIISVSRIARDQDTGVESLLSDETVATMESVTQELMGDACIVEVEIGTGKEE